MGTKIDDPMVRLPIEVVCQILNWLEIMDVCTCRLVSTRWNRAAILNMSKRRELNFAHLPIISEIGLNSILKIAQHLKIVRLDECWKCTTEENLILLARNCPKLRVLTVSRCKGVTDDAIRILCESCKDLQEMDFSSCYQISDQGIIHVSKCENLRDLCVSSCYGVTDSSIEKIARNCSKLMQLDVSWCPLVTDVGLRPLLKNCQIQLLRITCCKRVTSTLMLKLMSAGICVNNMF